VCCCTSQFTPTTFEEPSGGGHRKGALSVHTRVIHVIECILFVSRRRVWHYGANNPQLCSFLCSAIITRRARIYIKRAQEPALCNPGRPLYCFYCDRGGGGTFELASAHRDKQIKRSHILAGANTLMYGSARMHRQSYLHVAHWHTRAFSTGGNQSETGRK
jgi:hypothetical protein